VSWRICTIAAMWMTWFIRRFPARESRCRICSPEEAHSSEVLQDMRDHLEELRRLSIEAIND